MFVHRNVGRGFRLFFLHPCLQQVMRDGDRRRHEQPVHPFARQQRARLVAGLGAKPTEVLATGDYIAVFDSEETVRGLSPDLGKLNELDLRGVCVTAPGQDYDFVSRFFAPKLGIAEDPATGSAHCKLVPYWAGRLGKEELTARQVSRRGGDVRCRLMGDRVMLSGSAVTFREAPTEVGE